MAKQSKEPANTPFDLEKIRQLVALMCENELSEIDLRWEDARVRLRRGLSDAAPTFLTSRTPVTPLRADEPAPLPAKGEEPSAWLTIKSPIVGTFYLAPSPDAAPFVTVGQRVTSDTIVCIIEAMKVFNEIPAGLAGTIKEVLVENSAPVEYGQALFRIEA